MTKPLSGDLRIRLIKAVRQEKSCHEAADRFGVAASTVVKLLQRIPGTVQQTFPRRLAAARTQAFAL